MDANSAQFSSDEDLADDEFTRNKKANDERFNSPKGADHKGPVVSIEKNLVHKNTFLSASL